MHISVLLKECLTFLNLKEDSIIVDCTLGYGGHSSEILKRIPKGHLYCFDQDEEAIAASRKRLSEIGSNFTIIKSNFVHLKEKLKELGVTKVDSILFDLGVSSPQLDETERGFSFHKDAELDMRMDTNSEKSAKTVVNEYSYEELVRIFRVYGEEKYATSIARNIEKARSEKEIESTLELVEIIKNSVPEKYKRDHHPARKVFQAIRIEVNDELHVFESALNQALELLKKEGRVCVITFHSLEDSICKNKYKEVSTLPGELKNLPMIPEALEPKYHVVKVVNPSEEELKENRRARSAKLRVIERVKE
ncbi:MAG: 16S rRNA (cytosine(1402)-N(4))-methyltransferase RsmH [Firmicutes bacterium]|nr:16S rRNA (cytosine(1402)-N(4))-methyltransferase RsmH [Bacillota bacterium]